MENRFIYSDTYKRFHTYDYYLRGKYKKKTAKITLDAGFTCPHIQTLGGCIFCCDKYHNRQERIKSKEELFAEFDRQKEIISKKWKETNYIAYFQTGSNTYSPTPRLREIYEPFAQFDEICGIDIATRPDCLPDETIAYLAELSEKTDLTVELGLQTIHDITAKKINRGYTLACFEDAYIRLARHKIPVSIHIINSLPDETGKMMLETAEYISRLNPLPLGVKIHMLSVIRDTPLDLLYKKTPFLLLGLDEYVDISIKQLELLPAEIVIMRLTGDPEEDNLTAPKWCLKKFVVLNEIDKKMEKLGTYQGKKSGMNYIKNDDKGSKMNKNEPNPPKRKDSLTSILPMAKSLLDISIKENGVYADFTAGRGNDTLYIRKACPSAKIYSFDIQKEAIDFTRKRLEEENCLYNIELINDSHANFAKYIEKNLDGAIFNLGFLPGGDKSITTQTESTLVCLSAALDRLNKRGIIVVVIYPGHDEGESEGEKIYEFAASLDRGVYDCLFHRLINIPDAPYIVAFQKKT